MTCKACGWRGVPRGRTLRRYIGPTYVLLAAVVLVADSLGYLELRKVLTTEVALAILIGLPVTLAVLQFAERCGQCKSRKVQA